MEDPSAKEFAMKAHSLTAALAALMLALPSVAAAEPPVLVEFSAPERFSDARDGHHSSAPENNPNLKSLTKHVEQAAAGYLQPGQRLHLVFTNVDLAGQMDQSADPRWSDVRVVSHVYPPRLDFRFTLQNEQGEELKAGDVKLRDSGFMVRSSSARKGRLGFERRMLDRWMAQTLGNA